MQNSNLPSIPLKNNQKNIIVPSKYTHQSGIYIKDSVAGNLFNQSAIQDGYMYNIGFNQLTVSLAESDDSGAVNSLLHLDDYDRSVYDAICTLYTQLSQALKEKRLKKKKEMENKGYSPEEIDLVLNAIEYTHPMFTAKMVYQTMVGYSNVFPTDEAIEKITESIENMCKMQIKISLFSPKVSDNGETTYEKDGYSTNNALMLGTHEKRYKVPNKQTGMIEQVSTIYYIIYQVPVLYDYASNNSMLSMVPSEKIRTPSIYMSKVNIALVAKLRTMILNGENPLIIKYDELYKSFKTDGLKEASIRKRNQRIRQTVPVILDDWVKNHFIDNWKYLEYSRKVPISIIIDNPYNYNCEQVLEQYEQFTLMDSDAE